MAETASGFLIAWSGSIWAMLLDSAPFFLAGLILAGLIWRFVNERNLSRIIGRDGIKSVMRAALVGVPLPLCSCSVLPVATQLRRSGAGKAATVSFLVSTPESGADSILLTYSLTDPILTVARPVAAFLTAIAAGYAEILAPGTPRSVPPPVSDAATSDCECGRSVEALDKKDSGVVASFRAVIRYALSDLLRDLAPYLFIGFVLAGLVGAFFGPETESLPSIVTSGWVGYIGAIVIGLPLYVCATSSTPLAAVLLAAGVSPGAILVFLLVGPATNIASMVVVKRIIGFWATVRYVVVVVTVAVLSGVVLDYVYSAVKVAVRYRAGLESAHSSVLYQLSAIVLTALILYYSFLWLKGKTRSLVLNRS